MEENTERIAQLLMTGGEEKKITTTDDIVKKLQGGGDMNEKIDKIASLLQSKEQAQELLNGGFEENFLNYDQKLTAFLEQEESNKNYYAIGQKLIGLGGQDHKEKLEVKQKYQISQIQLKGQQEDVDVGLQKILQDLQFEGKIATKQELKEMDPKKHEYVESQTEKDQNGQPKIIKVNNYDLSNYLRTVASLTMSNKKFKDAEFPPGKEALLGDGSNKDGLKWLSGPNAVTIFRRCSEIFGENNFQLFKGGIEPQDMNQGNIGNCYFMGTIAALAETPSRIQKLFVNIEANPFGCYAINLCQQGLLREIIIDEYIPCYQSNGKPAFAHNNGNEIWAMLIEKV